VRFSSDRRNLRRFPGAQQVSAGRLGALMATDGTRGHANFAASTYGLPALESSSLMTGYRLARPFDPPPAMAAMMRRDDCNGRVGQLSGSNRSRCRRSAPGGHVEAFEQQREFTHAPGGSQSCLVLARPHRSRQWLGTRPVAPPAPNRRNDERSVIGAPVESSITTLHRVNGYRVP
jgi:hypothetical protein